MGSPLIVGLVLSLAGLVLGLMHAVATKICLCIRGCLFTLGGRRRGEKTVGALDIWQFLVWRALTTIVYLRTRSGFVRPCMPLSTMTPGPCVRTTSRTH